VTRLKTPLVVSDNGDLHFFASADDAERCLEPPDVRDGAYVAYDAEGRVLALRVEEERVPVLFGLTHAMIERVRVDAAGEAPLRPAELREALLAYLHATGKAPAGGEGLPLEDLVALAAGVAGMS
jgi:hypothetical protein